MAFTARWRFLNSSPYPWGIDGFYYAVQLRSLLDDQRLYYPASPLAFWLMLPGAWALGPIAGAKLGAALATSLAAVPVYAIVRRATGTRATGVLGAAIVATAAGSFYLTTVTKQGLGLTIALGFVAALLAALDSPAGRRRRAWTALAALLFAASIFTHLTSVGMAVITGLPPLSVRARRARGGNPARAALPILAALAVIAAAVVALVPAVRDNMGLANMFGPASFRYFGKSSFHYEVPLAALAATGVILMVLMPKHTRTGTDGGDAVPSPEARAVLIGPSIIALIFALPWLSVRDPEGLVLRLRIMSFVPLAICGPAVLWAVIALTKHRGSRLLVYAMAAAVMGLVPLRYDTPIATPNTFLMPGFVAIADHTPPNAVIVVHDRTIAFMVKWASNREARMRPPPVGDTRPVFRLASPGVLPTSVIRNLEQYEQMMPAETARPTRLIAERPKLMLLFPEASWHALLASVTPADRALIDSRERAP